MSSQDEELGDIILFWVQVFAILATVLCLALAFFWVTGHMALKSRSLHLEMFHRHGWCLG